MNIKNKINEDTYNFHINEGIKYSNKRNFNKAKVCFADALNIDPSNYRAYINLANIFILEQSIESAVNILFKHIEKYNPNDKIVNHLAKICLNYNLPKKLKKLFQIINISKKKNIIQYAYIYNIQGQYYEIERNFVKAKNAYLNSLRCDQYFFDSYIKLFDILEKTNDLKEFIKYLRLANDIFSDKNHVGILILYKSIYLNRIKNYKESQKNIIKNKSKLSLNNKYFFLKLLDIEAKNYENLKNYNKAFKKTEERNNILINTEENKKYNKENINKTIEIYKKFFVRKNIKYINNKLNYQNDKNLVFLVGFPRSGTTLLDTILRTHSKVKVLEEKPILLELRHNFFKQNNDKIKALLLMQQEQKDKIRDEYFKQILVNKDYKKQIIIDKLPLSIIEIGFIKCIFPNAKIILAMRHPCDVVISCFFSYFKINEAMINFLNWKDTLDFYNKVLDLFEFYEKEADLNMHIVKYEDVVLNFNSKIRELLEFLNVDYEKNLEKFYITARNRKDISTPSYSQIINPLYKTSINRWKNYIDVKNPELALKRWIKKYDY